MLLRVSFERLFANLNVSRVRPSFAHARQKPRRRRNLSSAAVSAIVQPLEDRVLLSVNTPPEAYDDGFGTVHDTPYSGAVYGYDADYDPLSFAEDSGPQHGTLDFQSDGSFTYTPDAGYAGSDSFTFTVSDGTDTSDPAWVWIEVTNSVPYAHSDGIGTLHDMPYSGSVYADDDDYDPVTYALDTSTNYGSLDFQNDGTYTYAQRRFHGF